MVKLGKKISTFHVLTWWGAKTYEQKRVVLEQLRKSMKDDLRTNVSKTFRIEEFNEAVVFSKENLSNGKAVILFD